MVERRIITWLSTRNFSTELWKDAIRQWAYARACQTSEQRAADLPLRTRLHNRHRPRSGIKDQTPISRLGLTEDSLLRLYSQASQPQQAPGIAAEDFGPVLLAQHDLFDPFHARLVHLPAGYSFLP